MLLHSLARDHTQDINQLILRIVGSSSSNTSLTSASSSSSSVSHKRHGILSHDPSLTSYMGTYEEPSDAPPARGSTTAVASMNVAISSTPSCVNTGKATSKKAGGMATAPHTVVPTANKPGNDRTTSTKGVISRHSSADQQQLGMVQGGANTGSKGVGLLSGPGAILPQPLPHPVRLPALLPGGSGVVGVVSGNRSLPASTTAQFPTTGAVRRLFSQHQQQQQSTSSQNSTVFSLLGPHPPSTSLPHSTITSKSSTSQASKLAQQSIYPAKSSVGGGGNTKQPNHVFRGGKGSDATSNLGQSVPSNTSGGKEKHPPISKSSSQQSMYSSVINTGMSSSSTLDQSHMSSGSPDVIEQPVQQIMKTHMLFPESATQLTKPKKKSTYSDAVGKKNESVCQGVMIQGSKGVHLGGIVSHPPPPPPPQAPAVAVGSQVPPTQHKLNLAPGTRPINSAEKVSGWTCL